nr:ATP-binding protein [uncultured Campylobacter sp.]
MKLKSLILKNFRSYKDVKILFDKSMNVIIGQNDVGKSTILEALDIFLEGGTIKIDMTDFSKNSEGDTIIIGAEFIVDGEKEILIDASNKTKLTDEHLLNNDGFLEIVKEFEIKNEKLQKEKVFIKAQYPKEYSDEPLINMKISDLKNKLNEKFNEEEVRNIDKRTNAEIRKALYGKASNGFEEIKIDITKEDAKAIWEQLKKWLPLYFLFQSDRANKDSDADIQNPLKSATKIAVARFEEQFNTIKSQLEEELTKIGNETIDKMREMGLENINSLKPQISNKSLDTLFSFSLESDNGIALNKRGSGFRRMVLLNYFRAEAERKLGSDENKDKDIIYAIEEPETAQHPNHQKMLIEALKELSCKDNYQLVLTTHTPEIAKMVDEENLILVSKVNDVAIINNGGNKLDLIADTLGILPSIHPEKIQKLKVVVCVEGYTDIEFLKNINKNIIDFKNIVDLENEAILMIFLGGASIQHYVNYNYLVKLNIPQIHIYDSDYNQKDTAKHYQYQKYLDKVINSGNIGYLTRKAEIENYIHPDLIKSVYLIETCFHNKSDGWLEEWNSLDLSNFINQNVDKTNKDIEPISSPRTSKKYIATELSKQLAKEMLEELDAFDEIKGWFEKIAELINR